MAIKLTVETVTNGSMVTLVAEVQHGPFGKWYRSEVDIIEPITAADLPSALHQLADELDRNLQVQAAIPAP